MVRSLRERMIGEPDGVSRRFDFWIPMARAHAQILADIRSFDPPEKDGWVVDWDELESLVAELWEFGKPTESIPVLLEIFERFPTADGHVLWGVMHGIESLSGYQPHLTRSVARMPSVFGVRMLGRMLNGGIREVEGELIPPMLRGFSANPDVPKVIRDEAQGFFDRHQSEAASKS